MAWGLFNKIKKGFKKVGSAFKKVAGFVNDKIVKPFKPIIKTAVNSFVPGAGALVDVASDGLDAVSKGNWKDAGNSAKDIASWASSRWRNDK